MLPPNYTDPRTYQRSPQDYWTPKHITGILIVLGCIVFGAISLLGGFFVLLPWCFLPFIAIAGIIGLVMLF